MLVSGKIHLEKNLYSPGAIVGGAVTNPLLLNLDIYQQGKKREGHVTVCTSKDPAILDIF